MLVSWFCQISWFWNYLTKNCSCRSSTRPATAPKLRRRKRTRRSSSELLTKIGMKNPSPIQHLSVTIRNPDTLRNWIKDKTALLNQTRSKTTRQASAQDLPLSVSKLTDSGLCEYGIILWRAMAWPLPSVVSGYLEVGRWERGLFCAWFQALTELLPFFCSFFYWRFPWSSIPQDNC